MGAKETAASKKCRLFAGRHGCRLFRNNSGMFYNEHGQPVYFGLGNSNETMTVNGVKKKISEVRKSSDDIGYTVVTVTPDMVGHKIAVFTSIEYKKPGFTIRASYPPSSRESKQQKWHNMCIDAGGIAGFACDKQTTDAIFEQFYKRFQS